MTALQRWQNLWQELGGANGNLKWFTHLESLYGEPHRHYHTIRHLLDCLKHLETSKDHAHDLTSLQLAIWFHDAIYDPHTTDNEERSAALAKECLEESGLPGPLIEKVERLILATKNHEAESDSDSALILDIDLSILGQAPEKFALYEKQIRQEYDWVPEPLFKQKRKEILANFLDRSRIYRTPTFFNRFEQSARANLRTSIKNLTED